MLLRRAEFPPIDRWAVADQSSDHFRIAKVAELPQLLRRPRILEEDVVDSERIQLTTAEAVDRRADPLDQTSQLILVICRHSLTGGSAVRRRGHETRLIGHHLPRDSLQKRACASGQAGRLPSRTARQERSSGDLNPAGGCLECVPRGGVECDRCVSGVPTHQVDHPLQQFRLMAHTATNDDAFPWLGA